MTLTSHHLRTMLERKPTKRRVHPVEIIARGACLIAFCALIFYTAYKYREAHPSSLADGAQSPFTTITARHQCVNHFWTDHLKKKGEK